MRRIVLAFGAVVVGLTVVTSGVAVAAPAKTTVRLACDSGVSATALITLTGPTAGARVQLQCDGTDTVDGASLTFRATTFQFDATVTLDGGGSQGVTGEGSVPAHIPMNPFGGHVGATLLLH